MINIVKDNPLAIYKNSDPMLEWSKISESTGISIQTLISISYKDSIKIGKINLANSEKIKRVLGIDLGKYYKNTDEKASGK